MMNLCQLAITITLALTLSAAPAFGDAAIQNLGESDTLLVMHFTDAQSAQTTITFTRGAANEPWAANLAWGSAGIIFGGSNTTYAGTSTLRALGISATQAVRTFDSSIANRPFDNVTIFRLYAGDIAIALSQDSVITEIWFVGTMVDDLLIPEGPANTCGLALASCCKIKTIGTQPYPWPGTSSCAALIDYPYPCGYSQGISACQCLSAACAFCFGPNPDPLCEDVQGLDAKSDLACAMHTTKCPGGAPAIPEIPEMSVASGLLAVILDRAQVVRDIENP